MKFTGFKLESFKGVSETIEIWINENEDSPFCIIGNNESGKTTILKGIEMIGKLCKGYDLRNGELKKLRPKHSYFTGTICLSCTLEISPIEKELLKEKTPLFFSQLGADTTFTLTFEFTFKGSKHIDTKKVIYVKEQYVQEAEIGTIFQIVQDKTPEIIYYDDFKFDVPDKIRFLPKKNQIQYSENDDAEDIIALKSKQNISWQEILNDLLLGASSKLEMQNNPSFQRDIIDWYDENDGDEDAVHQRMVAINNYLNTVVTKDWEQITGEKSIFDRFNLVRTTTSQTFVDFSLKVEAQGTSFSLHERSKGCKWFTCFKIFTEIRKHRNPNGTLFLLDEPASNLHIHPQEKILHSLGELSKEDKNTVIYATHSPSLIELATPENLIIVKNSAFELDQTKITCTKFIDYIITCERDNRAIEPILTRMMSPNLLQIDPSQTESIHPLQKIFNIFKTIVEKAGDQADKLNHILDCIEKIKGYIPSLSN